MHQQRNNPLSSMDHQGNANKERKWQFSRKKLKITAGCDTNEREIKIAVMKKLNKTKENSKGSSMSSEIKWMNRRSTLPNRRKLWKEPNKFWSLKNSIKEMKNGYINNHDTQWSLVAISRLPTIAILVTSHSSAGKIYRHKWPSF